MIAEIRVGRLGITAGANSVGETKRHELNRAPLLCDAPFDGMLDAANHLTRIDLQPYDAQEEDAANVAK